MRRASASLSLGPRIVLAGEASQCRPGSPLGPKRPTSVVRPSPCPCAVALVLSSAAWFDPTDFLAAPVGVSKGDLLAQELPSDFGPTRRRSSAITVSTAFVT